MSQIPASSENPSGTSDECNEIVKSVQQATTKFLDVITGLVQQSVRSPTSIPPTFIATSHAITTGTSMPTTSGNTGIASATGLSVSGPVHLSINRLGHCSFIYAIVLLQYRYCN